MTTTYGFLFSFSSLSKSNKVRLPENPMSVSHSIMSLTSTWFMLSLNIVGNFMHYVPCHSVADNDSFASGVTTSVRFFSSLLFIFFSFFFSPARFFPLCFIICCTDLHWPVNNVKFKEFQRPGHFLCFSKTWKWPLRTPKPSKTFKDLYEPCYIMQTARGKKAAAMFHSTRRKVKGGKMMQHWPWCASQSPSRTCRESQPPPLCLPGLPGAWGSVRSVTRKQHINYRIDTCTYTKIHHCISQSGKSSLHLHPSICPFLCPYNTKCCHSFKPLDLCGGNFSSTVTVYSRWNCSFSADTYVCVCVLGGGEASHIVLRKKLLGLK